MFVEYLLLGVHIYMSSTESIYIDVIVGSV